MLKFSNFMNSNLLFEHNNEKNVEISKQSLEDIISQNKCYAILVCENDKQKINILNHVNKIHRCYPLLYKNKNKLETSLLFVQKTHQDEKDFKNILNSLYELYNNIGIIYKSYNCVKILHENSIEIFSKEKQTLNFYEINMSRILKSNCNILGIKIPISENLKKIYRDNYFIVHNKS